MLTVEKIGGTSMTRFEDVLQNIIIGSRKKDDYYNRIFVVSAYGNVTNWLLEHKKDNTPGIYTLFADKGDYMGSLDNLLVKLVEINHGFRELGLDIKVADRFIEKRIGDAKNFLESMAEVMATGYVDRRNILLAAREILASIGEAHSAFNSVNILNNKGILATLVDLSGFHDPENLTIDERISRYLSGIDFSKTITVVTGYTKGSEGIMREFDRGYSEVTFSKIAVEVRADEAIIHKEFHLSSADPKIVGVESAIPVGFTNYDVADQLANVGMEAIHPKAAKPVENAGINIRIKNTFEPGHPGTLISKDYKGPESRVEIIAGAKNVMSIEVYDPLILGDLRFDMTLNQLLLQYSIKYILKTIYANSISLVIWENDGTGQFIEDLNSHFEVVDVKEVAIICAIGSNIAKPGVLSRATRTLAEHKINIESITQSPRQVNMQFIIGRMDFEGAITALNRALVLE